MTDIYDEINRHAESLTETYGLENLKVYYEAAQECGWLKDGNMIDGETLYLAGFRAGVRTAYHYARAIEEMQK